MLIIALMIIINCLDIRKKRNTSQYHTAPISSSIPQHLVETLDKDTVNGADDRHLETHESSVDNKSRSVLCNMRRDLENLMTCMNHTKKDDFALSYTMEQLGTVLKKLEGK